MVTITVHSPHCQNEALVRNGRAPNGKQLYRCRACRRQSRENPAPHAYPQARRYIGRFCGTGQAMKRGNSCQGQGVCLFW